MIARSITVKTLRWWPSFWSLLIGFGAAAFGGVVGGVLPRNGQVPSHRAATRRSYNGHLGGDLTAEEESPITARDPAPEPVS